MHVMIRHFGLRTQPDRHQKLVNCMKTNPPFVSFALSLALLGLAGCGEQSKTASVGATRPPAEVSVVTVKPREVEIETILPGRLKAVREAEIRARISGVVQSQHFTEGTVVKAGESLFQIDPAPLQAAYDSAHANLARAEANLAQTQARADRYAKLIEAQAVSAQDNDDAKLAVQATKAEVLAARAALETARLNLDYTKVIAPITGRVGKPEVTEGALVGYSGPTLLTSIHQLDPIYFDFSQSSAQWLRFHRSFENGAFDQIANERLEVTLKLEDGTDYTLPGHLVFTDVTVNPSTGMISLRAEFPNPDGILLPGMFARINLPQARDEAAITTPQRAVQRGPNGTAMVYVVNAENVVEQRSVELDRSIGADWIVRSGLHAGDRVIVEGLQKIRPGMPVSPVPFESSASADDASTELATSR